MAPDHVTFEMPDYQKEAAFYIALMGWKLRSDDGKQAVLDIGDGGAAISKQAPGRQSASVDNFCFVIDVERRGDTDGTPEARPKPGGRKRWRRVREHPCEGSDGWDLQISNGNGLAKARKMPTTAKDEAAYGSGESRMITRAEFGARHENLRLLALAGCVTVGRCVNPGSTPRKWRESN